jgi:septum formation protein
MTRPQSPVPSPQPLILASSSPRRRQLLAEAGYDFLVWPPPPDIECGVCSESGPAGLVAELALRKAASVVRSPQKIADGQRRDPTGSPVAIVLAADTVAECDGFILGKPQDEEHARAMLRQLSGREHRVLTGVCLWRLGDDEPLVRVDATTLRMDPLSDAQIDEYLAGGQWEGKAGAFGYQDRLGWVHIVEGSESNVVGLPMETLAEMLAQLQSA